MSFESHGFPDTALPLLWRTLPSLFPASVGVFIVPVFFFFLCYRLDASYGKSSVTADSKSETGTQGNNRSFATEDDGNRVRNRVHLAGSVRDVPSTFKQLLRESVMMAAWVLSSFPSTC